MQCKEGDAMRLIANKPCSFGGRQFYIGDEIPANLVADAKLQEKYGVITIVNDAKRGLGAYDGMIQIAVKGASNGQYTKISAKPEEIQQVFSILQQSAEDSARAIADVRSENVLILLHAADSRKTVKNAAKEQADKLFSIQGASNESSKENETAGTDTEGVDT